MFRSLIVGLATTSLIAGAAFAKGTAAEVRTGEIVKADSLQSYAAEVAKRTGASSKEVEKRMIEALMKSGEMTKAEKEALGRGNIDAVSGVRAARAVEVLRKAGFETKFDVVLDSKVQGSGLERLSAELDRAIPTAPVAKDAAAKPAAETKVAAAEKLITEAFGAEAKSVLGEIEKADKSEKGLVRSAAIVESARIQKGADAALSARFIRAIGTSKKAYGEIALGNGYTGACKDMDLVAVTNFQEAFIAGAEKGTDPRTALAESGKVLGDKLDNGNVEKGTDRYCGVQANCQMTGPAVAKACAVRGAVATN